MPGFLLLSSVDIVERNLIIFQFFVQFLVCLIFFFLVGGGGGGGGGGRGCTGGRVCVYGPFKNISLIPS